MRQLSARLFRLQKSRAQPAARGRFTSSALKYLHRQNRVPKRMTLRVSSRPDHLTDIFNSRSSPILQRPRPTTSGKLGESELHTLLATTCHARLQKLLRRSRLGENVHCAVCAAKGASFARRATSLCTFCPSMATHTFRPPPGRMRGRSHSTRRLLRPATSGNLTISCRPPNKASTPATALRRARQSACVPRRAPVRLRHSIFTGSRKASRRRLGPGQVPAPVLQAMGPIPGGESCHRLQPGWSIVWKAVTLQKVVFRSPRSREKVPARARKTFLSQDVVPGVFRLFQYRPQPLPL